MMAHITVSTSANSSSAASSFGTPYPTPSPTVASSPMILHKTMPSQPLPLQSSFSTSSSPTSSMPMRPEIPPQSRSQHHDVYEEEDSASISSADAALLSSEFDTSSSSGEGEEEEDEEVEGNEGEDGQGLFSRQHIRVEGAKVSSRSRVTGTKKKKQKGKGKEGERGETVIPAPPTVTMKPEQHRKLPEPVPSSMSSSLPVHAKHAAALPTSTSSLHQASTRTPASSSSLLTSTATSAALRHHLPGYPPHPHSHNHHQQRAVTPPPSLQAHHHPRPLRNREELRGVLAADFAGGGSGMGSLPVARPVTPPYLDWSWVEVTRRDYQSMDVLSLNDTCSDDRPASPHSIRTMEDDDAIAREAVGGGNTGGVDGGTSA
ncbi:hypothetical protein HK102_009669, partial [Quaeritorhiza haematococci]